MKKRLFALLATAVVLAALAGCHHSAPAVTQDVVEDAIETRLDAVEETVEAKLDAIEDRAEQKVTIPEVPVPLAEAPQSPKPPKADNPAEVSTQNKLSLGEAERIALDHAGLTVEEVARLHTEYDVDDRVPEYEVEFHSGRTEYHYEIHAETGVILEVEKELDD